MSQVDERVTHVVESCPHCGTALSGGWAHQRIQVIDLPAPQSVVVTEHVLVRRACPGCQRRVLPPAPGRAHGRLDRCRFGPRLLAAVATMAIAERLPIRQIRARLQREYGLTLSQGGVVGLLRQVAQRGTPAYDALRETIRGSPVVHADETGWRENGIPGYIWIITTADACLVQRDGSRAGRVIDALLSTTFGGVLVTDFYAAYDHLPGMKQRCWAHLWRDIDALEREYPADQELAAWVAGVRAMYDLATAPRPKEEEGMTPQAVRARSRRAAQYQQQLLLLCPATREPPAEARETADLLEAREREEAAEPHVAANAADAAGAAPADRPEATLVKRIQRYQDELFTFVRELDVPPTNNAAERGLRPLVIARKVSGGTRSAAGSVTRMTLASLAATARLRGDSPTDAFLAVLTATHPSSANPHTL